MAQTKIVYHEKELLQLIQGHLTSLGLLESAATLQREAGLPKCSTPPPHNPASGAATGHLYSPGTPKLVSIFLYTYSIIQKCVVTLQKDFWVNTIFIKKFLLFILLLFLNFVLLFQKKKHFKFRRFQAFLRYSSTAKRLILWHCYTNV